MRLTRGGWLGTLALGIHMPCRTVIFLGDSPLLTAVECRQMSGRAGRRGMDTQGKVVFIGVSRDKMSRLVRALPARLQSHYSLSISTVLRLLIQVSTTPDPRDINSALTLFRAPMRLAGVPADDVRHKQTQVFVMFALDHLRRLGVLNDRAQPISLAPMIAHLQWLEPANLAFVHILRSGLLRGICQQESTRAEQLIILLSYLFFPIALHPLCKLPPTGASMVVLPPLSAEAMQVVADYNQGTMDDLRHALTRYLATYGYGMPPTHVLPVSGVCFPTLDGTSAAVVAAAPVAPTSSSGDGSVDGAGASRPLATCPSLICSPFAALSGYGDDFATPEEMLTLCARPGVEIAAHVIPGVRLADELGQPRALNAFFLDFYRHGQRSELERANRVREGDQYQLLYDFRLVLQAISVALSPINCSIPLEDEPVLKALQELSDTFRDRFVKAFPHAR